MKYWVGLIIFSIISAIAASLYISHSFIGGAIMGILYAGVYYLGGSQE